MLRIARACHRSSGPARALLIAARWYTKPADHLHVQLEPLDGWVSGAMSDLGCVSERIAPPAPSAHAHWRSAAGCLGGRQLGARLRQRVGQLLRRPAAAAPLTAPLNHLPLHPPFPPAPSPSPRENEGIFFMTLSRPEARNAIGRQFLREMRECLHNVAQVCAACTSKI